MKKMVRAFEHANRLERELAALTHALAGALKTPHSKRDSEVVAEFWRHISDFRPKIHALGKSLKKIKKPNPHSLPRKAYVLQNDIYKMAGGFSKRLGMWDEVERRVLAHIAPERQPLFPDQPQNALLARVYTALHRLANPNNQDGLAKGHGCFADIDFPIQPFDEFMLAAYRLALAINPQRQLGFIDVGCGGGTKIFAAKHYFQAADGIEYDQGYARAAQKMLGEIGITSSTVFQADAMDFTAYGTYDIIYFYRPMAVDEKMRALEQRIIKQAKPGTLLIAPYETPMAAESGGKCSHISGPIFGVGIAQDEVKTLVQDAEATGRGICKRSADWPFDTGYWAPILDAASF